MDSSAAAPHASKTAQGDGVPDLVRSNVRSSVTAAALGVAVVAAAAAFPRLAAADVVMTFRSSSGAGAEGTAASVDAALSPPRLLKPGCLRPAGAAELLPAKFTRSSIWRVVGLAAGEESVLKTARPADDLRIIMLGG